MFSKKVLRIILLLVSTSLFAACGNVQSPTLNTNTENIVAGEAVENGDPIAASTVALYVSIEGLPNRDVMNVCTGTLIARRLVITAAHCLVDLGQELELDKTQLLAKMRVGFGSQIIKQAAEETVQLVKLKNFVVHEAYKIGGVETALEEPLHDVALLLLEADAPETAKTVPLVSNANALKAGMTVTLAGFGLVDGLFGVRARSLNKVDVQILDPTVTSTQWAYKVVERRSACSGDSGGPAYVKLENGSLALVGVTSWGDGPCMRIGVYTSVPALFPWIRAHGESLQ